MNIRQLHYFLVLCDELNYSHAADRLLLSRQALRQNVASLEDELGEPLFAMEKNKLSLTPRARDLRDEAGPVVEAFLELERRFSKRAASNGGVSVVADEALFPLNLSPIEAKLVNALSQYRVQPEVTEMPVSAVLRALDEGEAGLGLVLTSPRLLERFDVCVLHSETWCAYLNKKHPLSVRKRIAAESLAGETLLIESEDSASSWTSLLREELKAGCLSEPVIERAMSEAVIDRVRRNDGIGFGFASSQSLSTPRSTCHVPLKDQGIAPVIALVKAKGGGALTPAEEALWRRLSQGEASGKNP